MAITNQFYKSYIFIGESGSGKTECSLNMAALLKKEGRAVTFFDMDRTKGMYRARDCAKQFEGSGIRFVDALEFQDAPLIPPGITAALEAPNTVCVFDVGGNAVGAAMIGQFSDYFHGEDTLVLYPVNPLRPFSGGAKDVSVSLTQILGASGLEKSKVKMISNPCMGVRTDVPLVLSAHQRNIAVASQLDMEIHCLAVKHQLAELVRQETDCDLLELELYVYELYQYDLK